MNEQNIQKRSSSDNVKRWIRSIAFLLAALIPFSMCAVALFGVSGGVYEDTFLGALSAKYDRLCSVNEKKIVVIGGSSVAFGLDSELLSEHTGYEVVNFGLYATLGTKIMLDLSKANINEGDIVIISPELDPQTLSMYFNSEATWQALDGNMSMLRHIDYDNFSDLVGGAIKHAATKMRYALEGKKLSVDGIYRSDSFNEYGDIDPERFPREHNVMAAGYDVNQTITLTRDIFDEEFVAYLNDYIDWVEKQGATPYFAFCPINKSALSKDTDTLAMAHFYSDVRQMLNCEVIGSPNTVVLHQNYFYDTNYHLNDAGVIWRTNQMIEDLYVAWGRTDIPYIELPALPERPGASEIPEHWVENEWSKYFIYEDFGDTALKIIGVTDEGKALSKLEIPYMHSGKVVRVIDANAFSGCTSLTDITMYDNLTLLVNGAFADCPSLKSIHMMRGDEENIEASSELFAGASDDLKILFYTEENFSNFVSGYWWGCHAGRMDLVG